MLVPRALEEQLSLERVVGRGSFSTVYKASWWRPGAAAPETVCIKALLPQYCNPRSTPWSQFVAESSFLQQCDHQNVLKCHDLLLLPPDLPGLKETYKGPVLAMVLDYIKGGTLLQWLTTQMTDPYSQAYTLQQALRVLADTAEGLAHLHELRPAVIHRDIKPGNILIHKLQAEEQGGSTCGKELFTVRIADFGLHAVMDGTRNVSLRRSSTPETLGSSTVDSKASNTFHALTSVAAGMRLRPPSQTCTPADLQTVDTPQLEELLIPAIAAGTKGRSAANAPKLGGMERSSESDPVAVSTASKVKLPELCRNPSPTWSAEATRRSTLKISAASHQLPQDAPCDRSSKARLLPAGDSSVLDVHQHSDGSSCSDIKLRKSTDKHPVLDQGVLQGNESPAIGKLSDASSAAAPALFFLDAFLIDSLVDIKGDFAEWVFDLTEDTGSLVYMAPEVKLKMPYNTKADVYSFGVVMYEVLGRTLLAKTCLWESKIRDADDYLKRVGAGWRPSKPSCIPPALWRLVEDCWHGDPNRRPSLRHVALQLRTLMTDPGLLSSGGGRNRACDFCVIC